MTTRVLYVEDDADLREMFSLMLMNEGYDVVAVSSAEDAILQLQTQHYDLLLTDYNLTGRNADWLLQVARASGAVRDTPVLVLTAEPSPAGVDGYRVLQKPIDVGTLFAAIDEAVGAPFAGANSSPSSAASDVVHLTLYVTGTARESRKALRNLNRILLGFDQTRLRLEVCDVAAGQLPADALDADRIVVTPTLVRSYPLPKVWVYGDLSKADLVAEMIAAGFEALDSGQPATR